MPSNHNLSDTILTPADAVPPALLGDIRTLIDSARSRVAQAVNTELTLLYWNIGNRINREMPRAGEFSLLWQLNIPCFGE